MTYLPPLLYRGSVKNVRGEVSSEKLLFEFSDRYSVFDWGEMPDQLDGKGEALALMGSAFFSYLESPSNWRNLFTSEILHDTFSKEYLEALSQSELFKTYCEKGLNHHALISAEEIKAGPFLSVKNIQVLRPDLTADGYDYELYKTKPLNALVPLEVIFRLGLAPGNSLTKRLGSDLSKWQSFGFSEIPKNNGLLKSPVIDFSTKLEKGDRYLSYDEAQRIAGLSTKECDKLHQMTHLIALNLFEFHSRIGLELWDGKIEVAFSGTHPERDFMLVDSIGIDELRLLYKGKSFSKEFLREVYKTSSWYEKLEASKKEALLSGDDFKRICLEKYEASPMKLSEEDKLKAESVYKSYCNEILLTMGEPQAFPREFNLETHSQRYL
jgi:phosphoribosylaminoimidazole-succinocarboxamide synthase